MRVTATVAIAAIFLVLVGRAVAAPCEGPRPWKSPDAIQYAESDLSRFYDLANQTRSAYSGGDTAAAKRLAQEYLAAAPRFPCDWNYGNAVHNANAVLGLIALQEGDRAAAVRHLLAAGRSRGSPQLDTFGPSLLLAKRLAEAGEFDAVATYVRSIRRFWEAKEPTILGFLGLGGKPMTGWLETLAAGRVPDFGLNALKAP
jgi:hypothetical protein